MAMLKFKNLHGDIMEYTTKAEYIAWELAVAARKVENWRDYIPMGKSVLRYLENFNNLAEKDG